MSNARFTLRSLLIFVAVVAMVCGGLASIVRIYQHLYYTQVRTVRAALAEHPEIEKVWICTNPDVELEIEELFFTVANEPGVILKIEGIDAASKDVIQAKLRRAIRQQPSVDLPTYAEPWRWSDWK
jgi:hypothetical protein